MSQELNARILIVDDDGYKVEEIIKVWEAAGGRSWSELAHARSIAEAIKSVRDKAFDLMILDLRIPRRADNAPDEAEAKRFLEDVHQDDDLRPPREVIILSAFSDSLAAEQKFYSDKGWTALLFGTDLDEWRETLRAKFEYIGKCVAAEAEAGVRAFETDYCIISALRDPELSHVLRLPFTWESTGLLDATEFYKGVVTVESDLRSIVCGSAFGMGMVHSSLLCCKAWHYFRPRFIIMVGIAAGVRKATNLGDILIAEETWDYGAGKIDTDNAGGRVFVPDPRHVSADHSLAEALWSFGQSKTLRSEIENGWSAKLPDTRLEVRKGPIASGAAVVAHKSVVEQILGGNRKLIGLEMEGFGVYSACEYLPRPRPRYISVKSVCDFADGDKADDFQSYAAYTSAEFVVKAIQAGLFEKV